VQVRHEFDLYQLTMLAKKGATRLARVKNQGVLSLSENLQPAAPIGT